MVGGYGDKLDAETHLRSLCTRIFTLTLLPFGSPMSFSLSTAQPSSLNLCRVSTTISLTSSRCSIRAAPRVSAQAHDCGQPQLMSTPFTYGATRDAARDTSRGELAPNWTIVGTVGPAIDMVKSEQEVSGEILIVLAEETLLWREVSHRYPGL